jgi:hypothetical protein
MVGVGALVLGALTAVSTLAGASNTAAVTNTAATVLDSWSTVTRNIITSASCPSPGNCAAIGYQYMNNNVDDTQPILVSETNGHWGAVSPFGADLTPADYPSLTSVSCGSAGNCVAVGDYVSGNEPYVYSYPLLVTETNGVWDNGTMSGGGTGDLESVSCSSEGNCTAVGHLGGSAASITMTNGVWGPVVPAVFNELDPTSPGLTISVQFKSVACPAPSQCAAVGTYDYQGDDGGDFVASMVNGTWSTQTAIGAALTPAKNTSSLESVACSSVGNCAAVGYADYDGENAFRPAPIPLGVTETNGVWGQGVELAHALNTKHWGSLDAISCVANGKCVAVGYYYGNSKYWTELGVVETNGSWSAGSAIAPSVTRAYPSDPSFPDNFPWRVSCVASGQCFALFNSTAPIKNEHAAFNYSMMAELVGTKWIKPTVIGENLVPPGQQDSPSVKYSRHNEETALSCPTATSCTAFGYTTFNENKTTQHGAWVATPY